MRVVLISNPNSGRGRTRSITESLRGALESDSHAVTAHAVGHADEPGTLLTSLAGQDAAVIIGGDGTLHHALPELARSRVPVYVVPTGTENLFARSFGMHARGTDARRALSDMRLREIDLGECNGRLFALMCSVGYDAAVLAATARARRGPIRRWSYVPNLVGRAVAPSPNLAVEVDGRVIVDDVPGMVIVANLPAYARDADPAKDADGADGLLDAVFAPAKYGAGALAWLLACRLGRGNRVGGVVYARGARVRIGRDGTKAPACAQADGEAIGDLGAADGPGDELEIIVRPRALRVITPAR